MGSKLIVTPQTPPSELPEWLTPKQVAAYLQRSPNLIYREIRRGRLPSREFGETRLVHRSVVSDECKKALQSALLKRVDEATAEHAAAVVS